MSTRPALSHRIARTARRAGALALTLVPVYLVLATNPTLAFAHRADYRQYEVWSDRPIPPAITQVLDDATRRWQTSSLYDSRSRVRIFFCNTPWRLWLYGGRFDATLGGTAGGIVIDDVFIRAADIEANRLHAPGGGPVADAAARPLSYFIAHEVTHVDTARRYVRLAMLRHQWLAEGYADYVGKGGKDGDFDFDDNHRQYLAGARPLSFKRSGLYREFHLKTAWLLDRQGWTLDQAFAHPPSAAHLERGLRAYRPQSPAITMKEANTQ